MTALKWFVTGYAACVSIVLLAESTNWHNEQAQRYRRWVCLIVAGIALLWIS